MPKTTVVNIRSKAPYDVYVGRAFRAYAKPSATNPVPGLFGNPFKGDLSILQFKVYLYERFESDREFARAVRGLAGKRLGCWCAPAPCHADVIAELVNDHL